MDRTDEIWDGSGEPSTLRTGPPAAQAPDTYVAKACTPPRPLTPMGYTVEPGAAYASPILRWPPLPLVPAHYGLPAPTGGLATPPLPLVSANDRLSPWEAALRDVLLEPEAANAAVVAPRASAALKIEPVNTLVRTAGPSSLVRLQASATPATAIPARAETPTLPGREAAAPAVAVPQAPAPLAIPARAEVRSQAFDVAALARPVAPPIQQSAPHSVIADDRFDVSHDDVQALPERTAHWLWRLLKIAGLVGAAWLAAVLLLIVAFRFVNPPLSALMLQQRLIGQDIIQDWVALDDVAPQVIRAVVVSEDGRFCDHNGVDFEAMQSAIEQAADGNPRGASTISMQVAKNLFLWPSKSYVRKAIEIPLTYAIEALWNKRRIMEVYLNIAEWGPGIFGVEAASQFHFSKSARRLSEREAARLAVALPNPFVRDAGDPGPRVQRLAGEIQGRMRASPASQTACVTRGE